MHIYTDKRTGIKYISYTDPSGKRVRRSLGTCNKSVATLKAAQILDNKKVRDCGQIPWETFLTRYRAFLGAGRSTKTSDAFEAALKKLTAFKPVSFLPEVTPSLLDALAVELKSRQKDPSKTAAGINRSIRALKTAMRQAEFWDLIPPQNWRKVSKFKENKGRVEFHTPQEIKQILKALNANWRLVVLLGCRAGLRRGEIAALKWADVDFTNNQLYIAPNKTEKHRYVPISADLRKALLATPKKKGPYVVNVGDEKKRNSKDFLTAYYSKATAQLPFKCGLHKLRHTFASHLVQNGVDLYRVSKLLGHSSVTMTEIYAHLVPQDLSSAVSKLPAIK